MKLNKLFERFYPKKPEMTKELCEEAIMVRDAISCLCGGSEPWKAEAMAKVIAVSPFNQWEKEQLQENLASELRAAKLDIVRHEMAKILTGNAEDLHRIGNQIERLKRPFAETHTSMGMLQSDYQKYASQIQAHPNEHGRIFGQQSQSDLLSSMQNMASAQSVQDTWQRSL